MKISTLIIVTLVSFAFADIIHLQNGQEITNATVIEINDTDVKYKIGERQVIYIAKKVDVISILYPDGTKDEFEVSAITPQVITDSRDNKTYRTVKMGNLVWMAENLNYILPVSPLSGVNTRSTVSPSNCYNNKPENCKKYGRLYNWVDAMVACPKGWHLPNNAEWEALLDFAGGKSIAGRKLKAQNEWAGGGSGTDEYGFSALPGGFLSMPGGGSASARWYSASSNGGWWSASMRGEHVYRMSMVSGNSNVNSAIDYATSGLSSVRCVQD